MPASNETVPNRPLSGNELKKIILKDVDSILDKDGMFSINIAYGRVAYEITVKLHIDNPMYPEHKTVIASRPPATNDPDLEKKALERAPLRNTGEEGLAVGMVRERVIDSPNAVRVEMELPVTILRKDLNDGVLKEEKVTYDNRDMPEGDKGKVVDKDISKSVEEDWGA